MNDRASAEPGRVNILGVRVSVLDMQGAVSAFHGWLEEGRREYVSVTSVHPVVESLVSPRLQRILNRSGMITPDGMPLVWAAQLLGAREIRRVYGPELMVAVFDASLRNGWKHFFYGGAPGVPELLADRMRSRFPGLQIAGCISPPFGSVEAAEHERHIRIINDSGADFLWVGLGAPKQDFWMAENRPRLTVPILVGVGAAFDFLSGRKPQAPAWIRRSGLEWLYRLVSEPRRLGPRYAWIVPAFLFHFLLQWTGLRKYPVSQ